MTNSLNELRVSVVMTYLDVHLRYLKICLSSIARQNVHVSEIIIIDQSTGSKIEAMLPDSRLILPVTVIVPKQPGGFASNYNVGIRKTTGDAVFVLNPDTRLEPTCIGHLLHGLSLEASIGCTAPKILRVNEYMETTDPPLIDSTGMFLKSNIRHWDRGAGEEDEGQYDEPLYIFGATGAAVLFRRACLEDIRIRDQFFDEDFWSYREDADISWRLQNYGWKCLYVPSARVFHVRTLKPGSRRSVSHILNMHGVKNRYLLQINNISLKDYLIWFPLIFIRDLIVLAGVLLIERESIDAYRYLVKNARNLFRKRNLIRKKVKKDMTSFWFLHKTKRLVGGDYPGNPAPSIQNEPNASRSLSLTDSERS